MSFAGKSDRAMEEWWALNRTATTKNMKEKRVCLLLFILPWLNQNLNKNTKSVQIY